MDARLSKEIRMGVVGFLMGLMIALDLVYIPE